MNHEFLKLVRTKAEEKLLYLTHASSQMMRPDRMNSTAEVRNVIFEGEIIEDYPEDARGHSCLILGHGEGERALHVVCSPASQTQINGMLILDPGENHEMHVLSGRNEEEHRTVSH